MPQKFKKGDVVILKSGGPKMTIEQYKWHIGFDYSKESENEVICTWFDTTGKLQTREFEQDALKIINEDQE